MRTLLVVTTTVFAAGCGLLGPRQDATLTISLPVCCHTAQWPIGDTSYVTVNSSLDDPNGLAGLSILIGGEIPSRDLTAQDFVGHSQTPFLVPDAGAATFSARLALGGQVVAEGRGTWNLEPEVEWQLEVSRAPYPINEGLNGIDLANPRCSSFW